MAPVAPLIPSLCLFAIVLENFEIKCTCFRVKIRIIT